MKIDSFTYITQQSFSVGSLTILVNEPSDNTFSRLGINDTKKLEVNIVT